MSKLLVRLKHMILFLLSPLFAMAYMAAMPMVGLAMLLRGKDPRVDQN